MMMFFKRLFCRHDYIKTGTVLKHKNRHYIVPVTVFRCAKCGKEVTR